MLCAVCRGSRCVSCCAATNQAISIQGGLYASCAYSDSDTYYEFASREETCANDAPFQGIGTKVIGPAPGQQTDPINITQQALPKHSLEKVQIQQSIALSDMIDDWLDYIQYFSDDIINCGGNGGKRETGNPTTTSAAADDTKASTASDAKVGIAADHYDHHDLYQGIAIIVSGGFVFALVSLRSCRCPECWWDRCRWSL